MCKCSCKCSCKYLKGQASSPEDRRISKARLDSKAQQIHCVKPVVNSLSASDLYSAARFLFYSVGALLSLYSKLMQSLLGIFLYLALINLLASYKYVNCYLYDDWTRPFNGFCPIFFQLLWTVNHKYQLWNSWITRKRKFRQCSGFDWTRNEEVRYKKVYKHIKKSGKQ